MADSFSKGNGHSKRQKKKNIIKDAMSITISFMHYMKWIRVMLRVVFEKFEVKAL